ncbi:MAG: site-specific integrase [Ghiorsea sp.]
MRKEAKQRIVWLTEVQVERLLSCVAKHLVDAVAFTLQTGLRESNCSKLKWEQVDMQRGVMVIYGDQAKAGLDVGLPLNSVAMEILRRRARENEQDVYVFEYKGKVMSRFNATAWRNGLKKAGIKDFRWHDLRHTWASWHVQHGTPLHVLQKLGGWSTYAMVQVYAHLAPEHMALDAERIVPKKGIMRVVQS